MTKAEVLATCLGLGMLPFAPAVWGSLPPVVVYQVLGYLAPAANVSVMVLLLIAGSWICVKYAPAAIESWGRSVAQWSLPMRWQARDSPC